MMRKRRNAPVGLLHLMLWLALKHTTRIRGFQLDSGGRVRNTEKSIARFDLQRQRTGGFGWAVPRVGGRFERWQLNSIPLSSSSPTDGANEQRSSSLASSSVQASDANGTAAPRSTATQPSSSSSSPAFYDQAILHVRAGSGGSGATTFELLSSRGGTGGGGGSGSSSSSSKRQQQGAPNGGPGGRGGNVVLQVDPDLNTLAGLATWQGRNGAVVLRADNGMNGQARKRSGAPGRDVVVRVPPGTIVEELVANQEDDSDGAMEEVWFELGRLAMADQTRNSPLEVESELADSSVQVPSTLIIGRGGRGGDGNSVYANAAASRRRGSPKSAVHREGPTAGERKTLRLTLQFLADVAIIGMPNAGKSTFLAAVTRAKPKIANYAFTTIVPNLGVWINDDGTGGDPTYIDDPTAKLVLCDVPGLVQGASQGIGLGHEFLRHVERCSILVHLVDGTSPTVVEDYQMINRELAQYAGGMLASKPQVVIVNKLDLLSEAGNNAHDRQFQIQQTLLEVMPHSRLLWMSAKEKEGVDHVMQKVASFVQKVNQAAAAPAPADATGK